MSTREQIFEALFDLVWPVASATFKNDRATARTLRHWNDVAPEEMPALFLAQGDQTPTYVVNGQPPKWAIEARLYLYVTHDGALSPGEVLNPILDTIIQAFNPNAIGVPQQLGGLVQWARIDGAIETSEGTLGTIEVAQIPLRLLTV